MADKKILRLRGCGEYVDVVIDDVDRCSLMDVFIDLYKEAKKTGVKIAQYPHIRYFDTTGAKKWGDGVWFKVESDEELLRMLNYYKDKHEVKLHLWAVEEPCEPLRCALNILKGRDLLNYLPKSFAPTPAESSNVLGNVEIHHEPSPPKKKRVKHMASGKYLPGTTPKKRSHKSRSICTPSSPNISSAELAQPTPTTESTQPESPIPPIEPLSTAPSPIGSPCPPEPTQPTPVIPAPQQNTTPSVTPTIPTCPVARPGRKVPESTLRKYGIPIVKRTKTQSGGQSSGRETRSRVGSNVPIQPLGDVSEEEDDEDLDYAPEDSISSEESDAAADVDEMEVEDDMASDDEIRLRDHLNDPEDIAWGLFDEDDHLGPLYENGILFQDAEIGEIELQSWLLFRNREHFREVLVDYCIQGGFSIISIKSDTKRFTAECGAERCPWRIHASVLPDEVTWAIKTIYQGEHTCNRLQGHNPMATPEWGARHLFEDVRANPELPAVALNNILQERYGIRLKKSSMYKMREIAVKQVQGGHDESYALLPSYCEMIRSTNPGSVTFCVWKRSQTIGPERPLVFNNLFVSFHASIAGVARACRPLVGVDGTHLKGNYGGVLLTAVLLDGNNEIFPLAFSVVSSERRETWFNFFSRLRYILVASGRTRWTVICDRQKGVDAALEDAWPEADRRFCVRHLCMQYKKEYPGPLCYRLFWRIVNGITPYAKKKLEKIDVDSRLCRVYSSGRGVFEVKDGRSTLPVSTVERTCACGVWQQSGIPCKHVLAVINHIRADRVSDYVAPWFLVSTYREMYAENIFPIPDSEQWPSFNFPVISPPELRRRIGRPARNRKRDKGEKRKGKRQKTIRCSKCKQIGHNRTTCAGGLTARELRNAQGGEGTSRHGGHSETISQDSEY